MGLSPPGQLHCRHGVPEESREPGADSARQYHRGLAYLNNGQATLASTQMQAVFENDPDLPKKGSGMVADPP